MAQQTIVIEVPGTPISELETTSSVAAKDVLPIVQDGETKKVPLEQVADLVKTGLGSAAFKKASDFATPTALNNVAQASQIRDDAQNERIDNVEFGLASMANGSDKSFATYAEMLAYVPPEANVSVRNNDPDPTLRGTYIWNGTSYSRGYDPLDFVEAGVKKSLSYTDQQVGALFEPNLNIFDKTKVEIGKYYLWETGQKGTASNVYAAAGPYPIDAEVEFQVPANYGQQICFYRADMTFISGLKNVVSTHKFVTPPETAYICLTVDVALLDTFMLCKSSEYPASYVPYLLKKDNLVVNTDQIPNLMSKVGNELGVTYINIIDPSKFIHDYYVDWQSGTIGQVSGYVAAGPYLIKPETEYQTSANFVQQFSFHRADGVYISGMATASPTHKFITPADAQFIKITIPVDQIDTLVVAESNLFPDTYLPFGSKKIEGLVVDSNKMKTTEIWVSADLNDADLKVQFRGNNAIQLALDSITDASASNRYIIRVKQGIYKITKATEFLGYRGYPAMILTKDHVDIVGQGEHNTIVSAELPYNDSDIGPSIDGSTYERERYQTVYDYSDDSELKDITFLAKNLRYTIHIDNPNGANKTRKFENVGFIFKGNKGSLTAMGCGTSTGERTYIVGGRSFSDSNVPFASHNNTKFDIPSFWSFRGHNFTALTSKFFAYMQNDGSLLLDQLELIGCSFGGTAYQIGYVDVWLTGNTGRDSFNHAEWQITGYGNEPFLFNNSVMDGLSLRFKSNDKGPNVTIRIDKTSSAYPILIKNNQSNTDTSLYTDNREYIDGYIAQDGSVDLPALAFGCLDLSETAYLYDNKVNYTSLAKRLGDCTNSNKVLRINVNGVTNTVTFNKNYRSMTNAQIVAEINSQLSNAVADLYVYGSDYYPKITDVTESVYHQDVKKDNEVIYAAQTFIPKGSLVTKFAGTVKLANGNDKIFGVALDDIPVMKVTDEGVKKGQGRVLKRGYIFTNPAFRHYVRCDAPDTTVIGTRFKVVNGQLVTDPNGTISVDIDDAVVSINC